MPNLQTIAEHINGYFDEKMLSVPEVRELLLNPDGIRTSAQAEAQQFMVFKMAQHGLSEDDQAELRDILWRQNQSLSLGVAS